MRASARESVNEGQGRTARHEQGNAKDSMAQGEQAAYAGSPLLSTVVLALVCGVAVSGAGRPQTAHAAASVVRATNLIWAGNIAIGNGYQWVSAEWTVPAITSTTPLY
jgi:hypothetical protein